MLRGHNLRPIVALPAVVACVAAGSARASSAAAPPEFETFVVAREGGAPRREAASRRPEPSPRAARRSEPKARLNGQVMLTLFPGGTDLSLDVAGAMQGQTLAGRVSPLNWARNGAGGGFLEYGRAGAGIRLGGTASDLIAASQGVRIFAPVAAGRGAAGLGLYQRIGPGGGMMPAVDAELMGGRAGTTGMMLAADSSWRITQRAGADKWQALAFAGRDARFERGEAGLFLQGRVTPSASIYGRAVGWQAAQTGMRAGGAWSLGMTQQLSHGFVAVDHDVSRSDINIRRTGVGVFVPVRRQSLLLRFQNSVMEPLNATESGGTTRSVGATWFAPVSPRAMVWGTAATVWENAGAAQGAVSLGGSIALGPLWSVQTDVEHNIATGRERVRFSLGRQVNQDWRVALLAGPSLRPASASENRMTVGLQLMRGFRADYQPTGTISGQVLLDGAPCSRPVYVRVDDGDPVQTDARGRFRIRRVPVGPHEIRLALERLPADIGVENAVMPLDVSRRDTPEVTFRLAHVGSVRGVVHVEPDEFGQTDPTAGIGVTITAGDEHGTTTMADNGFLLGGLPAGAYDIALADSTIPPDFEVVGASTARIAIEPGARSPVVEFTSRPRRRKIEFASAW